MDNLNAIKDFFAGVAFPAAMAIYLLVVFRKALSENTATLSSLRDTIQKLCERLK